MIALPLGASLIFIFIYQIGFGSINNPIFEWITYISLFIGNIFFTCYWRELARAEYFKITLDDGLIEEGVTPDITFSNDTEAYTYKLNEISEKYKIGFVGDIMMMRKHELEADEKVKDFFSDAKIIVANLEGIVRDCGSTFKTQAHKPEILTQLGKLLNCNTQWLLCLGNNHSIDFGNKEFHTSLHKIRKSPNTFVFGRNDVSNTYYENPAIPSIYYNLTTATQWSNQHNWDCLTLLEDRGSNNGIRAHHHDAHFHILYPHWGFENERYVRTRFQLDARALLTGVRQEYPNGLPALFNPDPTQCWDLIIGHHPHVRQPIMKVPAKTARNVSFNRLVVFSTGNFTSGVHFLRAKKHLFGTSIICGIGPLTADTNQWAIGNVSWQRTVNVRTKPGGCKTKTIERDEGDYPSFNRNSFWYGVIIIVGILIFRILERFFF